VTVHKVYIDKEVGNFLQTEPSNSYTKTQFNKLIIVINFYVTNKSVHQTNSSTILLEQSTRSSHGQLFTSKSRRRGNDNGCCTCRFI